MPELPRTRTPIAEDAAASLLVRLLEQQLGRKPSRDLAALLLAQIWLETARGQSLIQNNAGNITVSERAISENPALTYWRPPWFEEPKDEATGNAIGWNDQRNEFLHKEMLAGRAPRAFRAYASLEAGFRDYVTRIFRDFASIATAAERGDVAGTAQAIKASRYCPDCEPTKTAKTLGELRTHFFTKGMFRDLPLVRPRPPEVLAELGLPSGSSSSDSPAPSSPQPSAPVVRGLPAARKRLVMLPLLTHGSHGAAVRLARLLLGYADGDRFDAPFWVHVCEWQGSRGLVADGAIGPVTWSVAIAELVNGTHALGGAATVAVARMSVDPGEALDEAIAELAGFQPAEPSPSYLEAPELEPIAAPNDDAGGAGSGFACSSCRRLYVAEGECPYCSKVALTPYAGPTSFEQDEHAGCLTMRVPQATSTGSTEPCPPPELEAVELAALAEHQPATPALTPETPSPLTSA